MSDLEAALVLLQRVQQRAGRGAVLEFREIGEGDGSFRRYGVQVRFDGQAGDRRAARR